MMKKLTSLLLSAALMISLLACGAFAAKTKSGVRIAGLKGPTTMGLVNLLDMERSGKASQHYDLQLYGAADEVVPKLIKGERDMAAIPANLAATLYQKTNGGIQVLAVNTLGVLYICELGDTVHTVADLKGKTIYSAGKGATPEYALEYVLKANGLDPETDVTIEWKSEHSECVAALPQDATAIAMLPQPFVTTAQAKNDQIRVALDLNKEWAAASEAEGKDGNLITGVAIVRSEFADEHPEAVSTFLKHYQESVEFVNANTDDAAALVGKYDIVPEAVAKKALPACNITFVSGDDMKAQLGGYLEELADQNAQAVGGKLPGDDFYYAL